MSITKRFLEIHEEELAAKQKMITLYENGYISGACLQGIARQFMARGIQSLTTKQKYLYEKALLPLTNENISDCEGCRDLLVIENAYMNIEDSFYWCSKSCYLSCQH